MVDIEYDEAKNAKNIAERGLSFEAVRDVDFTTALFVEDDRFDYGETRWRALGLIGSRLFAFVFTETGQGIRVISLRKANKREVALYEARQR